MGSSATDSSCTQNKLGGSIIGSVAQASYQTGFNNQIAAGTATEIFTFIGLTDLTGTTTQPSIHLGMVGGTPVAGAGYSGSADLDWWYTVDPTTIDGSRVPKAQVSASIAASVLTAGPATINLPVSFSEGTATLPLVNATLNVSIGAASTPTTSSSGTPPGHLAAENLDPAIQSFASMGQQTTAGAGKLCGSVDAQTLAVIPIPSSLVGCGLSSCSQCFSASNSMLDLWVTGCGTILGTQISSAQPDTVDPNAPVLGAGGPYRLSSNPSHVVTGCTDKNGTVQPLSSCLAAAAYSSYFQFTTDRVIVK
jgi:hypothetical protein